MFVLCATGLYFFKTDNLLIKQVSLQSNSMDVRASHVSVALLDSRRELAILALLFELTQAQRFLLL